LRGDGDDLFQVAAIAVKMDTETER
jgi:hypothetical protein